MIVTIELLNSVNIQCFVSELVLFKNISYFHNKLICERLSPFEKKKQIHLPLCKMNEQFYEFDE